MPKVGRKYCERPVSVMPRLFNVKMSTKFFGNITTSQVDNSVQKVSYMELQRGSEARTSRCVRLAYVVRIQPKLANSRAADIDILDSPQ